MESTGIFWKAPFRDLEKTDLHPVLINPRIFNRGSDKRKTDKSDATWLANLARLGLYRASFIPAGSALAAAIRPKEPQVK